MKKQLILAALTMTMVLTTSIGVMASEIAALRLVPAQEFNDDSDIKEVKDGIMMFKSFDDSQGQKVIGGTITKDEFEKVLNELNKTDSEKKELLEKYDIQYDYEKQNYQVYNESEESDNSTNINENSYTITAKSINTIESIFDDEMVNKALELGFIEEIEFSFTKLSKIQENGSVLSISAIKA